MKHIRRIWLAMLLLALGATLPQGAGEKGLAPAKVAAQENSSSISTTAPAPATAPLTATEPATQPGQPAISPALGNGARLALIRVEGVVDDYMLASLRLRIDRAVKGGASLIVFEFNTPGGQLHEALQICHEIKSIPVPTLAWVNPEAYSAGALMATSCNSIVMAPASAIGDCAPIALGSNMTVTNLAPTERAKALAPLLAEFRDSARRYGYNYCLLQSMCMLGSEVYEIENPRTGQKRLVNQADYAVMVEGKSIQSVEAAGSTTAMGQAQVGNSTITSDSGENPAGIMVETATDADQGQWTLVREIHDGRTLLTLNQSEAVDLGLARAIVQNEQVLRTFTGAALVSAVDPTWGEGMAWWLSGPIVRAVLLMLLMMGVWMEFHTGGLLIGATVAGIALVLLVVPPMLVGMTQIWHLALIAVGLVLVVLELLPPPTFGLLAVSGLVMMFVGLVLAAVPSTGNGPFSLPSPDSWGRLQQSILWMLLGFLLSFIGFIFISRHFGQLPMINMLVLKNRGAVQRTHGAATVSGGEVLGSGQINTGDTGSAVSELRPSGRAEINGQIVDVVTLGNWIGPGRRVRVIELSGNRIVVDEVMEG